MDVFTMVVIIVFIACAAGVADKYLRSRAQQRSAQGSDDVQQALDDLRSRVEVLEQIVTDENYNLSKEINNLEKTAERSSTETLGKDRQRA